MDSMDSNYFDFKLVQDDRGTLVIVEDLNDLPIKVKRIFYMMDFEVGTIRGQHANRYSEFIIVNLKGSVKIDVENGFDKVSYTLNKPNKGIFIPKMHWKKMFDFSQDSTLLVLASELYNENEYINNYEQFLYEARMNASNF